MGNLWEIAQSPDGTLDILRDGIVLHKGIPDKWLLDQLVHYGLTGPEYRTLREQLNASGFAALDYR